jgi:hypothetical protein
MAADSGINRTLPEGGLSFKHQILATPRGQGIRGPREQAALQTAPLKDATMNLTRYGVAPVLGPSGKGALPLATRGFRVSFR